MNWDKAMNLLIIMFISINLYLGLGNYNKYVLSYRLDTNQVDTVKALLEEDAIYIQGDLPLSYKPMGTVWLKPMMIDNSLRDRIIKAILSEDLAQVIIRKDKEVDGQSTEHLVYTYDNKELKFAGNQVNYSDQNVSQEAVVGEKKQLLATANDFVTRLDLSENYKNKIINYKIESYGAEVTYYEVYKGFPLFDSYVKMKITPEGVAQAELKLTKQEERVMNTQSIIPINRILFELSEVIDAVEAVNILNIELGYGIQERKRMHFLEEELIPMYKIEISGLNESLFVNAYTSELIN